MITKENLHTYYKNNVDYKYLSRQFEKDMPHFDSAKDAIKFFKDLFGRNFIAVPSDEFYECKIIHNQNDFKEIQDRLKRDGYFSFTKANQMFASQDLQIFEDGNVHIVF